MAIRWDELGHEMYEKMVSVLLGRLHPDARRIDGSGGDGGVDVKIAYEPEGRIAHAFELKSFTGRMDQRRRRQVKRSLDRVAELFPERWTLVVPIDPTPGENRWFRSLAADYPFPLDWCGKNWLDEKMSAFPEIGRYYLEGAKDEVLRLLVALHEEEAVVADAPDAMSRLKGLRDRLNEIDPHYRYEMATVTGEDSRWQSDVLFGFRSGDVRVDVYPRYFGAVSDRPVTVNATVLFGPDDLAVQDALGYGQGVTIPSRMIESVTVDAPSGLGGTFEESEMVLWPIDTELADPITIWLDVLEEDVLVSSCSVRLNERTGGPKGFIFTGTDSTGWLAIQLKITLEEMEVEVSWQLNPRPTMPYVLLPLCRWLEACSPGRWLKLRWPDAFEISDEIMDPFVVDNAFGAVVEALAYVQERSGRYWELPLSMSNKEAQDIVTVATLMKGETIRFTWDSFSLNLGGWGPELKVLENGGAMAFLCDQEISFKVEGVEVPIGRLRTHIPSARLADLEVVRTELAAGLVPPLKLVPGGNHQAHKFLVA